MYADDINITIAHDSFGNLQPLLNNKLLNINNWLVANKLSLNVAKTECMVIGSRQKPKLIILSVSVLIIMR